VPQSVQRLRGARVSFWQFGQVQVTGRSVVVVLMAIVPLAVRTHHPSVAVTTHARKPV
jgi:hypothetical protein